MTKFTKLFNNPKSFFFDSKNRILNGLGVIFYGMPNLTTQDNEIYKYVNIKNEEHKKKAKEQIHAIKSFVASLPKEHRDTNNNLVVLIKDDHTFEYFHDIEGLKINFANNGKNNTVILYEGTSYNNCKLMLSNKNICIIEKTKARLNTLSVLLQKSNTSIFTVGKNFLCWGVEFQGRDGRHFILGNDVLISYGISIWNGDGHTIFDKDGKVTNYSKDVFIGIDILPRLKSGDSYRQRL